jgi:hypothetical protein
VIQQQKIHPLVLLDQSKRRQGRHRLSLPLRVVVLLMSIALDQAPPVDGDI